MKIILNSEEETIKFAKTFANQLKGSEIIGLVGNLGAGKTVFSRALASGLKITNKITSPTFVLMKVYEVKKHPTIKYLCHIDAYRLKTANDLVAIGANEYFGRADTVSVIEWADKIKNILPKNTKYIKIKIGENNQRIINY